MLPVDTNISKIALFHIQVTSRSPMGAIVLMTGGLVIDDGWVRIFGSGSERMKRCLPDWNKGKGIKAFGEPVPYLVIGDDAIGGFFIQNGGALGPDVGKVYYFSPDNLKIEAMDWTYSDFINFCFNGDLEKFYAGYRWKQWRKEIMEMSLDNVMNFFPPLWSKQAAEFDKISRKPVPADEQFQLNLAYRKQLGLDNK